MENEFMKVTGVGAVVLADGEMLADVFMRKDGDIEAHVADCEYMPLLLGLVDVLGNEVEDPLNDDAVDRLVDALVDAGFCREDEGCCDDGDSSTEKQGKGWEHLSGEPIDLHDPHMLGRLGEELAVRCLESRGHVIVGRNVRTAYGEADIVFRDGSELVFAEVKTRLGSEPLPEEAVTRKKAARYRNMLLDYLAHSNEECPVRFDVMAVNVIDHHHARMRHYPRVCLVDC